MINKSLLAGAILALPALALAPRGAMQQSGPLYVPVARADDAKEPTNEELAKNAWAVLQKHCVECHGEGKRKFRASPIDKGTLPQLIEKKHIIPGKPEDSPIYALMIDKDEPMPPKKVQVRPTDAEVNTIKVWIEKGAPAWPKE